MPEALQLSIRPASEDIVRFLEGVTGAVEANSFESMCLWEEAQERGYSWKEGRSGYLVTVGHLGESPICISVLTPVIEGAKILFWHATSNVVHHELIRTWMEAHLPEDARGNMTDAMNFSNVLPRKPS